jgi:hypothetical protein
MLGSQPARSFGIAAPDAEIGCRMVQVDEVPERFPHNGQVAAEVAELSQRVETARNKLPLQSDSALFDVLSESELHAERQLAEWVRAQQRDQRRKVVAAEAAAADRERRMLAGVARSADEDSIWHRRAVAAQRRVSSPHARLARLHKRSEWSSRALVGVVLLGMSWAALNVQHNLVPDGNMANPLFWLSFGVEAMISIPLVVIMLIATTAASWGREIKRHKIIAFELGLLLATVGLNTGPHLAAKHFVKAAEFAVAPVMVGVVIWLHAWISNQYATLIADAGVPEEPEPGAGSHLVVGVEQVVPPPHVTHQQVVQPNAAHREVAHQEVAQQQPRQQLAQPSLAQPPLRQPAPQMSNGYAANGSAANGGSVNGSAVHGNAFHGSLGNGVAHNGNSVNGYAAPGATDGQVPGASGLPRTPPWASRDLRPTLAPQQQYPQQRGAPEPHSAAQREQPMPGQGQEMPTQEMPTLQLRREPAEPTQPVRRDPEMRARATAMRDEGMPLSRIADELGVSRRTLSRMLTDDATPLAMPSIGPIARQLVRSPQAVAAQRGHAEEDDESRDDNGGDGSARDDSARDDSVRGDSGRGDSGRGDQRPQHSSVSGSVDPDWIDAQFMEESRS